jgi:hypothetical protein
LKTPRLRRRLVRMAKKRQYASRKAPRTRVRRARGAWSGPFRKLTQAHALDVRREGPKEVIRKCPRLRFTASSPPRSCSRPRIAGGLTSAVGAARARRWLFPVGQAWRLRPHASPDRFPASSSSRGRLFSSQRPLICIARPILSVQMKALPSAWRRRRRRRDRCRSKLP